MISYPTNPIHQDGFFSGSLDEIFTKLNGKEISYNNLLDIDSAVDLMNEFKDVVENRVLNVNTLISQNATR